MSQSQVNSTFWCKQAELWNYLHWLIITLWVCMCDTKEQTDDEVGSTADLTRVQGPFGPEHQGVQYKH